MRFNRSHCATTLGLAISFAACLPLAQASSLIIGYSGKSTDIATYTDPSTGKVDAPSAASARTQFLNSVGNSYYYEDFQEVSPSSSGMSFNALGLSSYTLQFKTNGSPTGAAPTGSVSPGTDKNDDKQLSFQQGPIGTNTRGDFGKFDPSMVGAVPTTPLATADNMYLDVTGNTSVTFNFQPGETAVGIELNDLVQPQSASVEVDFADGSTLFSPVLGTDNADGTLATNNLWFVGVSGSAPITSLVINYGANPITIDNLYLGTAVPLPPAFLAGLPLLALLFLLRKKPAPTA